MAGHSIIRTVRLFASRRTLQPDWRPNGPLRIASRLPLAMRWRNDRDHPLDHLNRGRPRARALVSSELISPSTERTRCGGFFHVWAFVDSLDGVDAGQTQPVNTIRCCYAR